MTVCECIRTPAGSAFFLVVSSSALTLIIIIIIIALEKVKLAYVNCTRTSIIADDYA